MVVGGFKIFCFYKSLWGQCKETKNINLESLKNLVRNTQCVLKWLGFRDLFRSQIRHYVLYRFEQCEQRARRAHARVQVSQNLMCLSGSRHSSQARTACEYTTMSYLPPREKGRAQCRAVGSSENPGEGGSTILVGIICTLVEIGLTDAPKSGATRTHGSDRPAADGRDTALTHSVCFSPLFSFN